MAEQVQMDEEIAIVGSGPIELELTVALRRVGADHIHCDAHQIGHTIAWWRRGKQVLSTSERVAIAGIPIQSVHHQRITHRECLAYLRAIVEQYDLRIRTYEPVVDLERQDRGLLLRTRARGAEHAYRARHVILAKGDIDRP